MNSSCHQVSSLRFDLCSEEFELWTKGKFPTDLSVGPGVPLCVYVNTYLAPILTQNFWNKKASVSVFWMIEVGDRELGRKDVSLILNVSFSLIAAEIVEPRFLGSKSP